MTLLFPLGLIALLALPIVLLLHLLRERRRRVAVPSLLLWQHLPRQPAGSRSRILPVTLLLLLHLLVAALLGLALAQPRWLGRLLGGSQQLVLIVDTSTSMAAADGSSTRLGSAQAQARGLLAALGGNDSAVLIGLGPQARLIDRGSGSDRARLLESLDGLRAGGSGADLSGALTLAAAALDRQRDARIVVLTDGALPQSPPPTQQLPTAVEWIQVGDSQPNRAIVAFAAQSRGSGSAAAVQVYARVKNYDQSPAVATLRLFGDEQELDERFVNLPAEGEAELTWSLPPGIALLRAELDGSDGLVDDDRASLSLAQGRALSVLLVSGKVAPAAGSGPGRGGGDPLRRALEAQPGIQITAVAAGDYAASPLAQRADLTVFEGFLPERWPTGGVLVIAPPAGASLLPFGSPRSVERDAPLVASSPLFEGLTLGTIPFATTRQVTPPEWTQVLLSVGDQPLILRGRTGMSEVAVWNFEPGQSKLLTRLAFPLLVARTVRDLTPQPLPASLDSGSTLRLRPSPRATLVELTAPDGGSQARAAVGGLSFEGLSLPGLYSISERGADGALLYNGRVAVNAGSMIEADLRPQPEPAFLATQQPRPSPQQRDGRDLWPWLGLLALLVALGEWAYVHR